MSSQSTTSSQPEKLEDKAAFYEELHSIHIQLDEFLKASNALQGDLKQYFENAEMRRAKKLPSVILDSGDIKSGQMEMNRKAVRLPTSPFSSIKEWHKTYGLLQHPPTADAKCPQAWL